MPMIEVKMLSGRSIAQKRELASALTAEATRVLECNPSAVWVVFHEVESENWGVGGELMADIKS